MHGFIIVLVHLIFQGWWLLLQMIAFMEDAHTQIHMVPILGYNKLD